MLFNAHAHAAELVIGWESTSYTVFEGDQSNTLVCLVVENNKVLGDSATLSITESGLDRTAQGEDRVRRNF